MVVKFVLLILPTTHPYLQTSRTLVKKITGKWQNHIFISNKYVSQAYQMLQTTKTDVETDCLRPTSFQKQQFNPLNLLQICPSMSCVYAVLFIPCFNILSSYFYVLLNLVT